MVEWARAGIWGIRLICMSMTSAPESVSVAVAMLKIEEWTDC